MVPAFKNIKKIIAVASGKGGVGKSTIAVNLALGLSQLGGKVGLLDADIYGPSQPLMLGSVDEKPVVKNSKLQPIIRHGIKSMSIGYLTAQTAAMVWRGPMIGKAMQQMLNDTEWGELDYLIVDLPPGTGDAQLTLCQKMPVNGAVIVTTAQEVALADVRRACEMFMKLNVPVLGIVENMSTHTCSNCGHEQAIFGVGGGKALANHYELPLLAQIPLDREIRELTDNGKITNLHERTTHFRELSKKLAEILAQQKKDYSGLFPKIKIEHGKETNS